MDTPSGQLEKIALQRSLDAELASDAASENGSPELHQQAVALHVEAAKWCHEAGHPRRAHRHETWSKIHAQVAAKATDRG